MTGLHEHEAYLDEQDKLVRHAGSMIELDFDDKKTINIADLSSLNIIIQKIEEVALYLLQKKDVHHNYLTRKILSIIEQNTPVGIDVERLSRDIYIDSIDWHFSNFCKEKMTFLPKSKNENFAVTVSKVADGLQIKKPMWGYPGFFLSASTNNISITKLGEFLVIKVPRETAWVHDYGKSVKYAEYHQATTIALAHPTTLPDQAIEGIRLLCDYAGVDYQFT